MLEFLVILFLVFFLLSFKRKTTPVDIDLSKNSEYYMKEFPEICKPDLEETSNQTNPQIVVNITHNHLHVYPTPEGTQPHQH